MDSTRQKKVARAIQRDLSEILARELQDYPTGLITLSYVKVTPDLSTARAYITVLPEQVQNETLNLLNADASQIRHLLARRMNEVLRSIPQLVFYEDDVLKTANQLDELFGTIHTDQAVRGPVKLNPEDYKTGIDELLS
jgi:ribosome-binding factor A